MSRGLSRSWFVHALLTLVVVVFALLGVLLEKGRAGDPRAAADWQRGAHVYRMVCAQCHADDPLLERPGPRGGPALARADEALLREKLLHGRQPAGRSPAWPPTGDAGSPPMPVFPELAADVPALAAFLALPVRR